MSRQSFSPFLSAQELPAELLKELRIENSDDSKIINVFRQGGGILNISEVLVGMYKTYGDVKTRTYVTIALYKLAKKGALKKTEKKGEYELVKTSE